MYEAMVECSSSALAAIALGVWEDERGAPARPEFVAPEAPPHPQQRN